MARLIDAMRIDFDEVDISGCTDVDDIIWAVEKLIDAQPTVDAVPVVHGRWVCVGNKPHLIYECSLCKDKWGYGAMLHMKYCPNCGAHMKDGE